MPSLGADMESAVLMEWLVKEGERVTKGQVIAEIETSKGVIEIEVFEDGVIDKLLVKEETECSVGTPLALIRSEGEEKLQKKTEVKVEKVEKTVEKERLKISPAARKKANELGVDITKIKPKDGVIQLSQIEDTSLSKVKSTASADGMRQAIAAAMSRSNRDIPHYYLSTSINMTPALRYLEELNKNRSIEARILPVAILIRAVILALKEVPQLNAFWRDDLHEISKEIHPGVAISLREGGLITPALLNADIKNLDDTMSSLSDLITRTRKGKLRSSEMIAQTITITNLGDLGVETVYGVIYPPQVAIIGFGRIIDAPWAEGDSLCVRKIIQATLAGDHRATDGRTGALFLDKLNKFLQNPQELL